MTRYEWRKKAKEMTKNQDIQTKVMELKGQQQYDYLLELLSRAKAEGRASILQDELIFLNSLKENYEKILYGDKSWFYEQIIRRMKELKNMLKEKK